MARASRAFMPYLDALGADGWQIVSYIHHDVGDRTWPNGDYVLIREIQ